MLQMSYEVKASEVDDVYKHVDHSRIIKILEIARLQLLAELNHSSDSLIAQGIFPVISGFHISYEREVVLETVTLTCDRFEKRGKALLVHQRILNGRGKVAVEAVAESMFVNGATKRAIEIPPTLIAAMSKRAASTQPGASE